MRMNLIKLFNFYVMGKLLRHGVSYTSSPNTKKSTQALVGT